MDKKVVSCSFDSVWGVGQGSSIPFHWTFEITYGGQTVTLPEVEPEPSYTKMTEDQFNLLFNKIQTRGFAVEFELFSKSGDTVLTQEKISFKCDIASTSFEEIHINDTGAIVDGSVLKDLKEYQYKSGAWVEGETLTEQEAKEIFNNEIERMLEQFFPSTTYADYSLDETSGKYKVDLTNEYQFHSVVVYTMNADGITKIEGSGTGGGFLGVSVVSTVTTFSVNVGPQTITKPTIQ